MTYMIDQVLILLESDPGRLIYHILLASSIAGSLLILINQKSNLSSSYDRRLSFGIAALFLLHIAQFFLSGLVWQGLLFLESWLPLLDRFVTLLSSIIIVWLWVFPEPNRTVDRIFGFLSVLILAAALLTAIWWNRMDLAAAIAAAPENYGRVNGSLIDWALQVSSLSILIVGIIALAFNRSARWGSGMLMLMFLALGHIAHLLYLPYGNDYPTFLRFFHLAAFPFLVLLPLREISSQAANMSLDADPGVGMLLDSSTEGLTVPEISLVGIEPSIISSLLNLLEHHSDSQSYQQITTILAESAGSDFVALISPPDGDGINHLLTGYTQPEKRLIDEIAFDARTLPIFNSCLKMGRTRGLSASSSSPDRQTLAETFEDELLGPMLFIPVLSTAGIPMIGVILASSDEDKDWSSKQQDVIGLLAKFLVYSLSQAQEIAATHQELSRARQTAFVLHGQAQQAFQDQQILSDTLNVLEEDAHLGQGEIYKVSAQFENQPQMEQVIHQLQVQNHLLQDTLHEERENADQNIERLREDLRSALEEIAALTSMSVGLDDVSNDPNPDESYPQTDVFS